MCTQPSQLPPGGCAPRGATSLPARPLSPQAQTSAESLLLKPLPKLLFTAQRGAREGGGQTPPNPPRPGPGVGDLRRLHLGFFF